MKKYHVMSLIICLMFGQVQAQNIWGAEASTGQGAGQFNTNFIQTGDPNGLSIDDWTALTVYDFSGSQTPGAAYWTRNLLGYSQGAYWTGTDPVNSPSQANGVAMFDSDFLDNNGIQGAFGTGTSPSAHRGELISPQINLTGYTDELVMLKFYSLYRDFQIENLSIALSTDSGFSWGAEVDYRTYQASVNEGVVYVPFPEDSLEGVTNLTQVRIKFVFQGDYYFALVDDVTIMVYDEVIFDTIFKDGFQNNTPG